MSDIEKANARQMPETRGLSAERASGARAKSPFARSNKIKSTMFVATTTENKRTGRIYYGAHGSQSLYAYAGDAATNALKLYRGGCVLNRNPSGAKSTVVCPPRTTVARTLQSRVSGSLSFAAPAGASSVVCPESPHEIVTVPGAVRSATAHRSSCVCRARSVGE